MSWNLTSLSLGLTRRSEVQEATFEVDTSAVWETGPATSNVHLSYWLPSNTELGEQVPVIAVVSPYFPLVNPETNQAQPMLLGLAVANSFTTTTFHTGTPLLKCQFSEQKNPQVVSTTEAKARAGAFTKQSNGLGTQNWSNGKVGLYGKSYEGATQWEAAALAANT